MNPKTVFKTLKKLQRRVSRDGERDGKLQYDLHRSEGTERSWFFQTAPLVTGNHKDPLPYWWESYRSDVGHVTIVDENAPPESNPVLFDEDIYPDAPNDVPIRYWDKYSAQAYTKLYEDVVGKITPYKQSWLMTFAEMSKTTALIVDVARKVRAFQKAIKHPDKALRILMESGHALDTRVVTIGRKRRRHVGFYFSKAANTWLPVYYGVLPLLSDAQNVFDAFIKEKMHQVFKHKISASAGTNVKYYDDETLESILYEGVCGWTFKGYAEVTSAIPFLANYMGLINPLEAINDKIPFSFVANWFLGYERYLRAITDWSGLKVVGYVAEYRVGTTKRLAGGYANSSFTERYLTHRGTSIGAYYQRIPVNGPLELPDLQSYISTYGTLNPFNGRALRSLAAIALIAQRALPWLEKMDKSFKRDLKSLETWVKGRGGWGKAFHETSASQHVKVRHVRSLSTEDIDVYVPRKREHRAGYDIRKPSRKLK